MARWYALEPKRGQTAEPPKGTPRSARTFPQSGRALRRSATHPPTTSALSKARARCKDSHRFLRPDKSYHSNLAFDLRGLYGIHGPWTSTATASFVCLRLLAFLTEPETVIATLWAKRAPSAPQANRYSPSQSNADHIYVEQFPQVVTSLPPLQCHSWGDEA